MAHDPVEEGKHQVQQQDQAEEKEEKKSPRNELKSNYKTKLNQNETEFLKKTH